MPFMEFLRADIDEDTLNTFKKITVATPASRTESMAMLIWDVWLQIREPDILDAVTTGNNVKVGRSDLVVTDRFGLNDDVLWEWIHDMKPGTTQGSLSEYLIEHHDGGPHIRFDPPVLWPHSKIALTVEGKANTVKKMTAYLVVGYTLEKVSPGDFIAALVE